MLGPYSKMVASNKFLTKEEELELLREYKRTGNRRARDKVILAHQKFVLREAWKYARGSVTEEDLAQEANIALIRAVEKFDPEKGCRFLTYASWWVRAQMSKYIYANSHFCRGGQTPYQRDLWFKLIPRMDDLLFSGHTREESLKIVAKENELTIEQVRGVYKLLAMKMTVDYEIKSSSSELDDLIDNKKQGEEIRRIAFDKCRRDIERDIVTCRFLRDEPMSLRELGEKHNLCRERVRQLEVKLLRKIREAA